MIKQFFSAAVLRRPATLAAGVGPAMAMVLAFIGGDSRAQILEPPPFAPATEQIPAGARDITDVWWADSYRPDIVPADGSPIPFTPQGRQLYEETAAGLRDGSIVDRSRKWCTPRGVPRILAMPYPFQIVQTPGQTTILYEMNREYRVIYMDMPVSSDASVFPAFMGNAFGRWEDDTLVVETVGFKAMTYIDDTGLPHSDELRVTERYRKSDDGDRLDVTVTIEDPVMFTQPWEARFSYDRRPDVEIRTWACGGSHRDLSGIDGDVSKAQGAPQ